jgi:hypothetical protein
VIRVVRSIESNTASRAEPILSLLSLEVLQQHDVGLRGIALSHVSQISVVGGPLTFNNRNYRNSGDGQPRALRVPSRSVEAAPVRDNDSQILCSRQTQCPILSLSVSKKDLLKKEGKEKRAREKKRAKRPLEP